jgi:Mrp family chromosome partitioning ATPase
MRNSDGSPFGVIPAPAGAAVIAGAECRAVRLSSGIRFISADGSMNSINFRTFGLDAVRPAAEAGGANAVTALLAALWRRKRLIAAFCGAALIIAGVATAFMDNRYTAEVLIQARLAREDQKPPSSAATTSSPTIVIDAASMIETEVRIIRSSMIAKHVADRLELTKDPRFAVRESLATRARNWLRSASPWLDSLIPPPSPPSAEDLIAAALMRDLKVANDPKSQLINISYTSNSPELSAQIANAIAEEYLRTRSEAAARREFAGIAASYGPKHPILLSAQAKLDEALSQPRIGDGAQFMMRAEPTTLPAGPNRRVILGISLLGAFAVGSVLVLLLERADNGFRTDRELATETELPCLATLPEIAGRAGSDASLAYSEAARAITAATYVALPPAETKVVMLTSCVPGEGKSVLSVSLARTLIEMGRRTLIINVSVNPPPNRLTRESGTLEEVLNDIEHGLPSLERRQFSILNRTSGVDEGNRLVTAPSFSKLMAQARELYDVILIEAPPVMLFADALYLGRFADFVVHVVRWNCTPRRTVAAALQRMRNIGIRIDGIVLSRVDQGEHRLHCGLDPSYYVAQSPVFFAASSPEDSETLKGNERGHDARPSAHC